MAQPDRKAKWKLEISFGQRKSLCIITKIPVSQERGKETISQ